MERGGRETNNTSYIQERERETQRGKGEEGATRFLTRGCGQEHERNAHTQRDWTRNEHGTTPKPLPDPDTTPPRKQTEPTAGVALRAHLTASLFYDN